MKESQDRTLGLHPLRKGEEAEGRQMEPLQGGGHERPGVGTTGRGSEKGDLMKSNGREIEELHSVQE